MDVVAELPSALDRGWRFTPLATTIDTVIGREPRKLKMPQSLPDSSSQNRARSLYCGSRQPACALSLLPGCGGGLSTGRAEAGRGERPEWSELSKLPSALSAEAPGACQSCCAAHASKQARRAGSLPDSAPQRRQALLSAPAAAGMVCAPAAPAGARAGRRTAALARDGT